MKKKNEGIYAAIDSTFIVIAGTMTDSQVVFFICLGLMFFTFVVVAIYEEGVWEEVNGVLRK